MEYGPLLQLLGRSMWAQRFRPVDLDSVVTGPINLSSGSPDVDSALRAIGQDPNWAELARQLTTFKVRGLGRLWLRRDTYDLEVTAAYAWTGVLGHAAVEPYVRYVWDLTNNLTPLLGKFTLDETNLAVLLRAAAEQGSAVQAAGQGRPVVQGGGGLPAGEDAGPLGQQQTTDTQPPADASGGGSPLSRVINAILALHFSRTPTVVMLGIGLGGLDRTLVDEVQRVSSNPFVHKNAMTFSIVAPTLTLALLDGTDLSVHGQTMLHSLDLPQLHRTITFLAQHG